MDNIENIGITMPLNKPAPLTAFEGVSAMSPAKSVNSPSRKPFGDLASEMNSPAPRSPFAGDKLKEVPIVANDQTEPIVSNDQTEAQQDAVTVREATEAESKEMEALHIVDDLVNGVSPSKAGEKVEPDAESEAELDEKDLEDVIEFLSDKLEMSERRNDELEEYICLMQIEEGKWGAEQNALWNSMSAMQNELVKTRAQLAWAMKQLMKKDGEESAEASENNEEAPESADNKEEVTEEEAPNGGIVLDREQEAEDVGELLMMISDMEQELYEQTNARAYMQTQCRRMMLHMDYMAAEIAELRAERPAPASEEAAAAPAPSEAASAEPAASEPAADAEKQECLKQELEQLEQMCEEYEKACSPKSSPAAAESKAEVEEAAEQVGEKVETKAKEAETEETKAEEAESEAETEALYQEEAEAEREYLEMEHERAVYAHLHMLEEQVEAMDNHIEVVHWQRDIYASECGHMRDYVDFLQRQLESLHAAYQEGAHLRAAAEVYAARLQAQLQQASQSAEPASEEAVSAGEAEATAADATEATAAEVAEATETAEVAGASTEAAPEAEAPADAADAAAERGLECEEEMEGAAAGAEHGAEEEEEEELSPMSVLEYVQFENTMLKCHVNELLDRCQEHELESAALYEEGCYLQEQNEALVAEWHELKREAEGMLRVEQARSLRMEARLTAAEAHLEEMGAACSSPSTAGTPGGARLADLEDGEVADDESEPAAEGAEPEAEAGAPEPRPVEESPEAQAEAGAV